MTGSLISDGLDLLKTTTRGQSFFSKMKKKKKLPPNRLPLSSAPSRRPTSPFFFFFFNLETKKTAPPGRSKPAIHLPDVRVVCRVPKLAGRSLL